MLEQVNLWFYPVDFLLLQKAFELSDGYLFVDFWTHYRFDVVDFLITEHRA
jgi:hypothetical protein